ncbi:TPA: hypothetical protein IAC10_11035 [Candidatus Scatousia excrementigallinarum]|uniref:Uncharacterized protein n=1 Tax=Candidatus Scatousia excrementigallinarum TaxID=2840935 RepID=A0A9D1JNK2_9BACT|nr:hypothetical protein [Candidatus Scatousia excrementigallinarum]
MNQELQIIIDYVEGKSDIKDFRKEFLNNPSIKKLLESKICIEAFKSYNYNLFDYFNKRINPLRNDWDNVYSKYVVWYDLKLFLDYNHIAYDRSNQKYQDDYSYILDIQPSWLDISVDQSICNKIIAECPKDLSKTKRIAWGKARIKELFKYDKTYPRWIQDPEWPIINGKPLVFSHQKKAGKDDERVYYYFYDPDTKEETIITQMY